MDKHFINAVNKLYGEKKSFLKLNQLFYSGKTF